MALEYRATCLGRRQQDPHRQQVGLDGQEGGYRGTGPRARGRARHQIHGDFGKGKRGCRGGIFHTGKVCLPLASFRSFFKNLGDSET